MRNYTNSEIEELLDGCRLQDDLVRTLLMFAAHEYFFYKCDENLNERDLFEFACVVLSWLSLVKWDEEDTFRLEPHWKASANDEPQSSQMENDARYSERLAPW